MLHSTLPPSPEYLVLFLYTCCCGYIVFMLVIISLQFGEVPLVKAAYKGWTQFVRILIQYSADVNALDLVSQWNSVLLWPHRAVTV